MSIENAIREQLKQFETKRESLQYAINLTDGCIDLLKILLADNANGQPAASLPAPPAPTPIPSGLTITQAILELLSRAPGLGRKDIISAVSEFDLDTRSGDIPSAISRSIQKLVEERKIRREDGKHFLRK